MSEWQDISTAPKDTEFLGVEVRTFAGAPVSSYAICQFGWPGIDGEDVWFNGNVVVHPTHWMPLPPAPAFQQRGTT